jgi:U3 small nucleolar ribonucleoprotein component
VRDRKAHYRHGTMMSTLTLSRDGLAALRDGYAVTLADADGDEALTLPPETLDEDTFEELEAGEEVSLDLDGQAFELTLAAPEALSDVDDEDEEDEEEDDGEDAAGPFSAEARRGLDWAPEDE